MPSVIIGISGRKGRGKTTLANLLLKEFRNAKQIAFADALKNDVLSMLEIYFGDHIQGNSIDLEELERNKLQVFGPILQGIGEFVRQYISEDDWVDQWYTSAKKHLDVVIAPDVRHENEAAKIRELGGYIVGIYGEDHRGEIDHRSDGHSSEIHVDDIVQNADFKINNSGDCFALGMLAFELANQIKEEKNL